MEIKDAPDKLFFPNSNTPLPKYVRTSHINSHVIFIKQTEFCYCIVKGSKSLEARLRNSLMKTDANSTLIWRKVNYKELPEFSLTKSFYYWILKNKGQTLAKDGKSINLNDVKGFKSNTDRERHSYNGEGSNIDNEIPLKSLVSTDEKLVSLYITLIYNNISYSFYLDYDGRLNICLPECGEHATQNPRSIAIDNLLLDIYFDIIPFLKAKHNEAIKNGWGAQEIAYRKESAIQIIQELMAQNGIQKEEIK